VLIVLFGRMILGLFLLYELNERLRRLGYFMV
jgi:hypothetical protein